MPQRCTVCDHKERATIDRLLIRQVRANRAIALRYGLVHTSLQRHRENHLPAKLAKAEAASELARADQLLAELRDLHEKARGMLEDAEAAGDLKTALGAVREARGCLELLARLLGELKDTPEVHLHLSTEWQAVQAAILSALAPFPQVRMKVAEAIDALANGNGHAARR
jgi:hypothetical protein